MTGKVRRYFVCGNTARGYYSLLDSNIQGMNHIYLLFGAPGIGKSTLIQQLGDEMIQHGRSIEYFLSPFDPYTVDGLVCESLKLAVVDVSAIPSFEAKAPGAIEHIIDFAEGWDCEHLTNHRSRILALKKEIDDTQLTAYETFRRALDVHDEWERIYIDHMHLDRANQLKEELIQKLFDDVKLQKKANVRHRFLGAATPIGAVDCVPELIEDIQQRFYIKGRPGSGKSTLLKALVEEAMQRGLDAEVYHCGFDPHSLDMVIVRELDFAIFDSTAPHEYFPERETDIIIDTYVRTIEPGTDERFAGELRDIKQQYAENMKQAIGLLAQVKKKQDELAAIYRSSMNFSYVEKIGADFLSEFIENLR